MDAIRSDEELVMELFASPPRARNRLRVVVGELQRHADAKSLVRWSDLRGSGTSEDPLILRYPIYDPLIDQLITALFRANAQPIFGWPEWDSFHRYRDADSINSAPLADVLRVITTVIRGERFCDGAIDSAITSGVLLAAAARVTSAIPPVGRRCAWPATDVAIKSQE